METVTCPKCSARIPVEKPRGTIVNGPEKSVFVVDWKELRCPNPLCGAELVFSIREISGIQFSLHAIERRQEKRIIVPNLVMPKKLKG